MGKTGFQMARWVSGAVEGMDMMTFLVTESLNMGKFLLQTNVDFRLP